MVDNSRNALIALGANLPSPAGDPPATLRAALAMIGGEGITVAAVSRLYATPAWPPGSGPDFVNAAAVLRTALAPRALLERLHGVERALGRDRRARWAPRSIDLDLLAVGDAVLPDPDTWQRWAGLDAGAAGSIAPDELILPHPRLAERAFVLVPLAEVAPDWRHPVTGLSVAAMRDALDPADREAVRPIGVANGAESL
ncbi:MAG: 2-amino-4-hydroxy-6-hydroxymethyldihydropteridine diphosphokinase [Alphaproteobacteria bacterium]|nr:MAG: 2-amino-4-hydroxy-6-hydroxymethyldihydropteridine diphosphokinase [Alphaproteobacteria bacterium]